MGEYRGEGKTGLRAAVSLVVGGDLESFFYVLYVLSSKEFICSVDFSGALACMLVRFVPLCETLQFVMNRNLSVTVVESGKS